jgi:hypothetical protein
MIMAVVFFENDVYKLGLLHFPFFILLLLARIQFC